MYKKIGVAIAFSPRCEAIVGEAVRLQKLFDAELIFIHIGEKKPDGEKYLNELISCSGVNPEKLKVIWETGVPSSKIISIGNKEKIDLLLAGALKRETIVKFYIGSVARKLIRRSKCSVLMLINPSNDPKPFKSIVINGSDGEHYETTIKRGIELAKLDKAKRVHIFKPIKLFGLSMAITGEEDTENDYETKRRKIVEDAISEVKKIIRPLDKGGLKINIKVASGKPGFELRKFVNKVKADLLIVEAPTHKLGLFDRIFTHYLEQVMEDLPSNLLIDKSK